MRKGKPPVRKPRQVRCPKCQASPGAECISAGGAGIYHAERIRVAVSAAAEQEKEKESW